MECQQVREELASRLATGAEGTWPEPVAQHLEACAACRAELDVLRDSWAALARWPEARPGEEVRARLLGQVRRRLAREAVFTVSGWTPAVLAAVVGVALSLGLSLLVPYSALVSLCRQAFQIADSHPAAFLIAGMVYGVPLAVGVWLIRRRAMAGTVVGSLEASLLFLLILAPYVIIQCREFPPPLQAAFVSGLGGAAVVSSLAALWLARLVPAARLQS